MIGKAIDHLLIAQRSPERQHLRQDRIDLQEIVAIDIVGVPVLAMLENMAKGRWAGSCLEHF
jgi:hypothetical protein